MAAAMVAALVPMATALVLAALELSVMPDKSIPDKAFSKLLIFNFRPSLSFEPMAASMALILVRSAVNPSIDVPSGWVNPLAAEASAVLIASTSAASA